MNATLCAAQGRREPARGADGQRGESRPADFDGTERSPMRIAGAGVTSGVVARRAGNLDTTLAFGERALAGSRRSLPSLARCLPTLAPKAHVIGVAGNWFPDDLPSADVREARVPCLGGIGDVSVRRTMLRVVASARATRRSVARGRAFAQGPLTCARTLRYPCGGTVRSVAFHHARVTEARGEECWNWRPKSDRIWALRGSTCAFSRPEWNGRLPVGSRVRSIDVSNGNMLVLVTEGRQGPCVS